MRFKCMCVVITTLLLVSAGFSQECPKVKTEKAAVQFLLDKKASNTEADRYCVDHAFTILGQATEFRNKNYIKFLAGMLDFERWTPGLTNEADEEKYPAMDVLVYLQRSGKDVAPYLINGIKESDSEVLRTNAALTLYESTPRCTALSLLRQEDEKEDVPYEQKLRLEAAAKLIDEMLNDLARQTLQSHKRNRLLWLIGGRPLKLGFSLSGTQSALIRRDTIRGVGQILLFLVFITALASAQTSGSPRLGAEDRVFTASQVNSLVQGYFFSVKDLPSSGLDASYKTYLRTMLASDERRQFDLATIEFVAELHNGHTFFWDKELDKITQPLGYYAAPLDGYWVVQSSFLPDLKPGDIIVKIDNTPIESFFQHQARYISASSIAAQRHNLFLLPYLFPEQFTLTLDGERKVEIDREKLNPPGLTTEGRWLKPGVTAYLRIPSFSDFQFEANALDYVRRFQNAKTLIIDVRNNAGGILPKQLIRALMNRPYREWKTSTFARSVIVDSDPDDEKHRNSTMQPEAMRNCKYESDQPICSLLVTWGGEVIAPAPNAFRGHVILLVDGGCVSACEELVEPFKNSGRGIIVGETTEGSSGIPYTYDFHNGMTLKISVKRQYFPDGSEFEGVGIKPDVEIHPTIESLKSGQDVILQKALELAAKP
jgi:carboxyl-terminal processing protease